MNLRFLTISSVLIIVGVFSVWVMFKTDRDMSDSLHSRDALPTPSNFTKIHGDLVGQGRVNGTAERLDNTLDRSKKMEILERKPSDFTQGPTVLRERGSISKDEAVSRDEIQNNLQQIRNLYDQGSDGDLIWKLKELMSLNPDVPEYAAAMIEIQIELGNWRDAELAVRHLLRIDPKNEYAKSALVDVLKKLGRNDEIQGLEKP